MSEIEQALVPKSPQNKVTISTLGLISIAIISVDSIRNLPINATYGFSVLFFYIVLGICFFLPLIIAAREFASESSSTGGSYLWIKSAFGENVGFLSIWLQWVYNMIWYPTIFSFMVTTFGSLINDDLPNNKVFLVFCSLGLFLLITLLSLRGVEATSHFSMYCSFFGTLFPMGIMIILGIVWMAKGETIGIDISWKGFFPSGDTVDNLSYFGNILFSLLGIEVIAMHAKEVENPKKSYPIALTVAGIFIIISLALSSLALCIIVPPDALSNQLAEGAIKVFRTFFDGYGMGWASYFMGAFMILGSLGVASSWIIGLARGLEVALKDSNFIPSSFIKKNRHDIPYKILIFQTVIFVILMCIMLFMPDGPNSFYSLLSILTSQFSLFYYMILFSAVIKLNYKREKKIRVYSLVLNVLAILASLTGIIVGYFPASSVTNVLAYEMELIAGEFIFIFPIIIFFFVKKRKDQIKKSKKEIEA